MKKKSIKGFSSIVEQMQERISGFEDWAAACNQSEEQREKRMKKREESLRNLQDTIRSTNVHILEISERDMRERRG